MPQWAGSSWYYLRYIDPKNSEKLVDKSKEKYWSPVDVYVGGAEHATRHLIYARFWHKFLFDLGVVNYEEPFIRLHNVGLILAEDGKKMSKRYGNVINPDSVVEIWGADTMRLYVMFMGPFNQEISWKTDNMIGLRRFLERVWKIVSKVSSDSKGLDQKTETLFHKTIKKVGEDIESFSFNTAVSSMMILSNELEKLEQIPKVVYEDFLKLLAPFAPHMTEEIWHNLGNKKSIHLDKWPEFDHQKIKDTSLVLVVQINGRVRAWFEATLGLEEKEVYERALSMSEVNKWLEGKDPKKIIFIKNKLINIVV
jgi:leucyl-tRNA synthetase